MTTMFEEIQIEKVRANPANIREDLGDMERLAAEVKTVGIRSPLVVYPHPDIEGDFMIQEGHRRRQAALAAGLSELPCIIVEAPKRPAEDVEVMLSTGRNHKPLTRLEEARGESRFLERLVAVRAERDVALAIVVRVPLMGACRRRNRQRRREDCRRCPLLRHLSSAPS